MFPPSLTFTVRFPVSCPICASTTPFLPVSFSVISLLLVFCMFLGPGGGYNCLAGRDASRCLATMDLQTSATDISQISAEEFRTLMQWTTKFEGDYPIVGHLEVESAKACGKTLLGTIREAGDEGIQLGDASDLPPFPTAATTSSSSSSSTTSTALPIPFPFLSASTLATSSKGSDSPPLAPKPRQRIPGFPVPS